MTQESVLRIAFDSRDAANDAKAFNVQLEKVQEGGDKASKSVETFGKTASTTGTSVKGLGTHVESSTKALSDQTNVVDKNVLAMKNLAKIVAGYISISKGIEAADGYTQMAARIRNATTSAQEYNLVQDRLLATANTTFRALSEAQEVYLSLAGGMKSLGYSTKQTLDLSDSLSFAFTANATRADQAQSAMDALSKSMAKGKIDADAWISIVTGADNVIADMAKTTGKTETEIRQLGATGKASLEDLIKTLVATREQNEALANNMENSLKDGLQKLTNETTVFLGKLNETTKLTGHAAAAIGFLSEHIDKLAIVGGVAASIYAGRLAAAFAESAIKAGWSAAAIVTQTGAMTASATAAKSLYLALGGPVGLTIGLVGAAASMVLFSKDTDTATSSLDQQRKSVSELTEEYQKMSALKLVSHIEEINDKIDESEKKINKARRSLVSMVTGNPEFVTDQDIKRQNLMLDQLEKIQKQGKSTSAALQEISNSKLFTPAEIKDAQKQLSVMAESNSELSKTIAMRELANSSLDKASGLYGELIDQSEKLTAENQLLNKSLDDGKESFKFITDSLLQSAANAGLSAGKISQLKQSIDEYNKGTLSATALLKEFQKYIPISETDLRTYLQLARNIEANEKSLAKNRNELTQNDASQKAFNKTLNDSKVAGVNSADGLKAISTEAVVTSEKVKNLDSEIQKFIQNSMNNTASNVERLKLYNSGLNKEAADIILKAREAEGLIGTDQQLSLGTIAIISKDLLLQHQVKKVEEDRQKLEEKKTKELQRQQEIREKTVNSKTIDSVIARGEGDYNSFNRGKAGDSTGQKMNLIGMTVGEIRNLQKKGSLFAAGKYQVIPKTLQGAIDAGVVSTAEKFTAEVQERIVQQYLLTVKKGRGNIEDYIQGKSDDIFAANLDLAKEFASVASPATGRSYYNGDKAGNKASISVKEAQNALKASRDLYAKAIAAGKTTQEAWGAAFNGATSFVEGSDSQKDLDKLIKARAKTEEEIKQLQSQYDTDAIKRSKVREDEINKATILNQLDLIPKIKERYDAQDTLASIQFDNELNGYKWTEEQKINYHNETAKLMLDIDGEYSEKGRAALKASLDKRRDLELSAYRHLQQEKQFTYDQEITKRRREIDDRMARNTMSGGDYQRYVLAQGQKDDYKANDDQLTTDLANIEKQKREGEFKDIQEYYRRLEEAKLLHKENELAISHEYQKKEADVLASQKAAQLQLWSSLVSQGQTTWSQMTQSVKDGAGEQSASYKTMFAMQQAFSIASTLIATHLAAMQVTADGANPTLFGKVTAHSAILAMGYAQAGLIASQAIAGFATGGQIKGAGTSTSDSIPIMASDGEFMTRTWAVQKIGVDNYEYMNRTGELPYHKFQEQLLLEQGNSKPTPQGFNTGGLVGSPQQSSPMVERQRLVAMRESNVAERGGESNIIIHQSVSFDTSGGEAQINTSGQKAIAESLNGEMNNWARRESMQGGVLFNAIKRIK